MKCLESIRTAALVMLTITVACCWGAKYGHGKDDACVKKTFPEYSANLNRFFDDLRYRKSVLEKRSMAPDGSVALPLPTPIPIPPGIELALVQLQMLQRLLRKLECTAMPMRIYDGQIQPYPLTTGASLPPPCDSKPILVPPKIIPKRDQVISFSKSVGRIEIRNNTDNTRTPLGSGFIIGIGAVATSCHIIAPLLKDGQLYLEDPETLVIDFETTPYSEYPTTEFVVKRFLGCSQKKGLDVAVLDLCETSAPGGDGRDQCMMPSSPPIPVPSPLPLLLNKHKDIDEISREFSVLVGYPDFAHFIDPTKRAIYAPYLKADSSGKYDYSGKFVSIDGVESEDECDDDMGIVLDTVTTSVGESGSVVIDLHEPMRPPPDNVSKSEGLPDTDPRRPVVVGMHTCCSAFFEKDYGDPPEAHLPCARLRRTFHNQDISTRAIIKNSVLRDILKRRNACVVDMQGNPVPPWTCK
jgi:hypothetical protein